MFGDTELPLWIVWYRWWCYKHTKNEFEDMTGQTVADLGKSMDVPYMVIQIGRSGGKEGVTIQRYLYSFQLMLVVRRVYQNTHQGQVVVDIYVI